MIGGVTRLGGLPGVLGRVTLSARGQHCHVNVSRSVNPPTQVTNRSNTEKIAKHECVKTLIIIIIIMFISYIAQSNMR